MFTEHVRVKFLHVVYQPRLQPHLKDIYRSLLVYCVMSGRTRGYRFEHDIAARYESCGWRAWRLGASSTGLPDILAVENHTIHVHELKTTIYGSVRIPYHQICRCVDVASSFDLYDTRIVLSARFGRRAEHHMIWNGGVGQVSINVHGVSWGADLTPISWDMLCVE